MRTLFALLVAAMTVGSAHAQTTTSPTVSSGTTAMSTTSSARSSVNAQLVRLLQDGYDIKAAFAEAGVPYVVLQKTTSAYLCRGAGSSTCEKLN
jgi:hypothetical protein